MDGGLLVEGVFFRNLFSYLSIPLNIDILIDLSL